MIAETAQYPHLTHLSHLSQIPTLSVSVSLHLHLQVFPYCMFNVAVMLLLEIIEDRYGGMAYSYLEITPQGHSFLTLVVAFLLVSRVNIGLSRYNEARGHLGTMFQHTRGLIQNTCVFSSHTTHQAGKEWRHQVAYRTLLLLRLSMAVLDYPTTLVPAWDVPELQGEELAYIKANNFTNPSTRRWAHGARSEWEETMRVPIHMCYLLRKAVHKERIVLTEPVSPVQEAQMWNSINGYMGGYYGMRKFMTTPVPFPLIQMARTFLFLYIFTVPFVLLKDESSWFAHCFAVFLVTYGFMGMEVVAIELDNPFGDDANDFDNE
jgi:predicted membrane chloride channel (bestrophin family)